MSRADVISHVPEMIDASEVVTRKNRRIIVVEQLQLCATQLSAPNLTARRHGRMYTAG